MTRQPVAGAGARDQVARLLTLVPFVHQRDGVRLEEAARLLGVSSDQVLRDLKVLFMCGLPGGLPDDLIDVDLDALETEEGTLRSDGVIRVENADYLARPLRLSATEASAVLVALRLLRDSSRGETARLVDQVVAKIERAFASSSTVPIDVTPSPYDAQLAATASAAGVIEEAVAGGRQLRITYFVPSRGEETTRVVDPRGIASRGVFSYLDACCHRAGGERLFRLDRIRQAEVLDTSTTTPRVPPRDLEQGLFADADAETGTLVTLRLSPEAMWATDYYPVREIRPLPDGGAEVDLVVVDRRWLLRLLTRLAPGASVLAPAEVAEIFADHVTQTLALYRTPGA